jgi:hypothetical protein
VLTVYLLYEAARTSRLRWWVAYAAIAWTTVLTHYHTLFWLPGTVAGVLVAPAPRRFMRQWLVTHVGLALALLPLVWLLIVPLSEGGPKPWLRETWLGYPPVLAVPKSLWALLPSGGYPGYLGALTVAAEAISHRTGLLIRYLVLWGGPAIVATLTLVRIEPLLRGGRVGHGRIAGGAGCGLNRSLDRERVTFFLLSLTLLFLLMAFAYSAVAGSGYVVGRYDLAAWPTLIIGVAMLIDSVARRAGRTPAKRGLVGVVLTALLAASSVATITGARLVPISNDLTARARQIAATVGPDDLVVSLGMYKWFMTYEWHQLHFSAQVISFPPSHDRQLCWYDAEVELADLTGVELAVAEVTAQITRGLDERRRVWLLAHGEPEGARWKVDRQFFARLRRLGIEVRLQDEELGLAELVLIAPR